MGLVLFTLWEVVCLGRIYTLQIVITRSISWAVESTLSEAKCQDIRHPRHGPAVYCQPSAAFSIS
jgi:hypothetical protein